MKTICFFNSTKTWGGGEKWHYESAMFFHKQGYKVYFALRHGSALHKKLINSPIECINIKVYKLSFLDPLEINHLKKILKFLQIDVIIINLSADMKLAGLAAKAAGVKKIIYRRGTAIATKNSFVNRYFFGKILTDVLANSEATKSAILKENANLFPADKIKVIYNPINIAQFINKPFNKIYEKQSGELVFGNLGRLVPQKNQAVLIELAARLKEKNILFKILIGGSGPLEKTLKAMAEEKGVVDKVIFAGFLDNVKDLLMSCDVFIFPSLWEGFGYVTAEASLCEKPVLAYNIGSNPELVINNKSGFLVPLHNIDAMLEKMVAFYEQPQLINEFGNTGFDYARGKFAEEKIRAQLLEYIG